MGRDRFLVAHTSDTMLVGDLDENKLSEVETSDFFVFFSILCYISLSSPFITDRNDSPYIVRVGGNQGFLPRVGQWSSNRICVLSEKNLVNILFLSYVLFQVFHPFLVIISVK